MSIVLRSPLQARDYVTKQVSDVTTKLNVVEGQIGHSRHAINQGDRGDGNPFEDVATEGYVASSPSCQRACSPFVIMHERAECLAERS